jgi:hypothetical protein
VFLRLEIAVKIMLPDGSSEMVCAMLDTGSRECNVTNYERAMRWRAAKAQGSFKGKPATDTVLQSYTAQERLNHRMASCNCDVRSAFAQTLREATLAEDAEFWEIPELGEFTMPKVWN